MEGTSFPRIRALFVDIDGTLVGAEQRVSQRVYGAVERAQEAGCEVVVCTGRSRFTALPVVEQLPPPPGYLISSTGGVVSHAGTGEVLLKRLLTVDVALQVARLICELGGSPYIYQDATGPGVEHARVLYHPELPTDSFVAPPRFCAYPSLLDELPFTPVEVAAFGHPDTMVPLVEKLLPRLPESVTVVESGIGQSWGVEIFARGVDKRLGLETVAARLGVPQSSTMAIGDNMNDVEMLRWAALGVAMGNAREEVRAAADCVTATVDEDGVADAIEQFVLVDAG